MKYFFTLFFISALYFGAAAQDEELYEMSLEDLMQIDIYSASKKAESLFDAPLSSSALTAEEIVNSGATSIPEALRLIPGLIVREQANGVYDIHLRGLDNLIRYGNGADASNSITLVMIDGRPVFNHNIGGVYWEALPISIVDISRIEVVRGPSAPLYGPNAVAGVINIITKKVEQQGINVTADLRGGGAATTVGDEHPNTYIGGAHIGYKFNDKFSMAVSGNMEKRDRHDDVYFSYVEDDYIAYDRLTSDSDGVPVPPNYIADKNRALDKKGGNIYLNFTPSDDANFQVQVGGQDAVIQKIYRDNAFTPFTESEYRSTYVNASAEIKGLKARYSLVTGFDNLNSGSTFPLLDYDYTTHNILVEYDWNVNDNLTVRPGVGYQYAKYSDMDYIDLENFVIGVLNSDPVVKSSAASLSLDYSVTDNLRITGGIRMDKFNSPDDTYISYQLASTYNINDKNLIRAVIGKSNSGSFIASNFVNINLPFTDPSTGAQILYYFQGNQELDLFQIKMFELGYRTKLSDNFELNLEAWRQTAEDTYVFYEGVAPPPFVADYSYYYTYENVDAVSTQYGLTMSANYVPSKKVQIKPFLTFQKTETKDLPTKYLIANQNRQDVDNDQTPSLFGGFYLNYKPSSKLNINLNPYYMSSQTQYSFHNLNNPNTQLGDIDSKLILNAKVSYDVAKSLNVYFNARNLTNNESREYGGGDSTHALILGGVRVKL